MFDLRALSLEGVERLCQADMTWKLFPLYYCPRKRKRSVFSLCLLFFQYLFSNRTLHQWQKGGVVSFKSMESLESTRLCSRDRQSRLCHMSDTLEVLWCLPVTHLAALLWTISDTGPLQSCCCGRVYNEWSVFLKNTIMFLGQTK